MSASHLLISPYIHLRILRDQHTADTQNMLAELVYMIFSPAHLWDQLLCVHFVPASVYSLPWVGAFLLQGLGIHFLPTYFLKLTMPCMLSHFRRVRLSVTLDCSLPGSSVHGILQARVLEWVAIFYPRGFPWPRDWTHVSYVSCIGKQVLYH